MILLLCVVILLFGAAAGGSWYLQSLQNKDGKDADTPKVSEEKPVKPAHPAPHKHASGESAKPIIRPTAAKDAEHLTQLASALQQQKDQLDTRAKELDVRAKQMNIVHDEIKKEQTKLNVMRKEIQVELTRVQAKLEELDKKLADGKSLQNNIESSKKELLRTQGEFDSREAAAIKAQIKTFEKMDPDAAAIMLVGMANSGKLDTAVKILSMIQSRQAAAIFAEIQKQDEALPGQIFSKMFSLKTPTISAETAGN
jgi:flagellar motility protein MotE (MotC chaperone)